MTRCPDPRKRGSGLFFWSRENEGAGRGVRPYGSATRGAMGGRPQGSPLRKRYKGGQGRAESPSHGFVVPAPFRQGDRGDGGTDCHSQCAHWLRNDRVFHEVRGKAGRVVREADPYGGVTRSAGERDDVGIVPYGGLQEVRLNSASPSSPPAGGVEPRPYGSATRGAMGGRPQGSPLRKRYKGGRGERNPPVTASPCPAPFRQGGRGRREKTEAF